MISVADLNLKGAHHLRRARRATVVSQVRALGALGLVAAVTLQTVLPGALTLQRLQPVSGRHPEVFPSVCNLRLSHRATRVGSSRRLAETYLKISATSIAQSGKASGATRSPPTFLSTEA